MAKPTYSKKDRLLIDKKLRGLSQAELSDLTSEGARILRDKNRDKQREYNARYRQRLAMAAKLGLLDQEDPS